MSKISRTKVERALAHGKNHIGDLVMWSLRGAVMSETDLQALYVQNGLDWDKWGMGEITARVTFRTALRLAKQQTEKAGLMFRPIDETDAEVVIGVVNERKLTQTRDLKYSLECRIMFDKKNEAVKTDDDSEPKDQQHPAGREVRELYKNLRSYYTSRSFVMLLTCSVHKMESIVMRETGGVYFVPHHHHTELMKLRAVINQVGRSYITALPIWDDESSKQDVGHVTKQALEEELAKLAAQIKDFVADPPRRDTMRNRLEEFQAMRSRASMFSTMLSVTVSDLEQGITDCEDTLKKLLQVETTRLESKRTKKTGSKRRSDELTTIIRKVQEEEPKKKRTAKATPKPKKKAAKKSKTVRRIRAA